MQKSGSNQNLSTHRQVRSSTTLNRKYVRRPVGGIIVNPMATPPSRNVNDIARMKLQERAKVAPKAVSPTAIELKNQAIKKALAEADRLPSVQEESQSKILETIKRTSRQEKMKKSPMFEASKIRFGIGRVLLALGCAVMAVIAIVCLANAMMPDISSKVDAKQIGIENPFPSRIPRGYAFTDAISESDKITLVFKNNETKENFTLTEERSSWDSAALLSNYVKETYGENYVVINEQRLTIYVSNSDAAWVNDGVVYKIKATSGTLTKKQIQAIAMSL